MTLVLIAVVVFVAALLANGLRNGRRFDERYPLSAALRREAAALEATRDNTQ